METNLEDFSTPNLFLIFEWTKPYVEKIRSMPADEATAVNSWVITTNIS